LFKSLLNISDLTISELEKILEVKHDENRLEGKNIGLLFEKPSTRTRLSFTVGISHLGGKSIELRFEDLNISRDETFEDTFKAFDCYLDGLIYRTTDHSRLSKATRFFSKPIINALSDISHPCQAISDLYTLKEKFGTLKLNVLWMGDMNNVCYSLVETANLIKDLKLIICCPSSISQSINWEMKSNIILTSNLDKIDLKSINCVMTDVFISMNDKENHKKIETLKPYSVTSELMSKTSSNSVFMHCLPAKVGYEVSEEVFKSDKSIVWKQAYNRMIAQKNLLQLIDWDKL